MGGFGSGRRGYREKVEHHRSLDVNRLHKAGCLAAGFAGGWHWMRDGERVANITMRCDGEVLTLDYRYRINHGPWQDVTQPVRLERTACAYGGTRPWFICPGEVNGRYCGRRVAKLYAGGAHFLCRHCYGLAYASQSETAIDRLLSQANKLRVKLGGQPGVDMVPPKPLGMHWRTYERHYQTLLAADEAYYRYVRKRWPGSGY